MDELETKAIKWTVLFRAKGRSMPQRNKRFECSGGFAVAKEIALTKIGDSMYEGLYPWTDADFQQALHGARAKQTRKREGRANRITDDVGLCLSCGREARRSASGYCRRCIGSGARRKDGHEVTQMPSETKDRKQMERLGSPQELAMQPIEDDYSEDSFGD